MSTMPEPSTPSEAAQIIADADKPLPSQIRCVFVGGPMDGRTADVDAYLPWQTPPDWIACEEHLQAAWPRVEHVYVRDGDVEELPGAGRRLRMRYDRQQNKFMTYAEMQQTGLRGPARSSRERLSP